MQAFGQDSHVPVIGKQRVVAATFILPCTLMSRSWAGGNVGQQCKSDKAGNVGKNGGYENRAERGCRKWSCEEWSPSACPRSGALDRQISVTTSGLDEGANVSDCATVYRTWAATDLTQLPFSAQLNGQAAVDFFFCLRICAPDPANRRRDAWGAVVPNSGSLSRAAWMVGVPRRSPAAMASFLLQANWPVPSKVLLHPTSAWQKRCGAPHI